MLPGSDFHAYLADNLYLTVEPSRAALDQRHVRGQAHLIDMTARIEVVQRIEDDAKGLEPGDVELVVLDVGVVGLDVHAGVESAGGFLRNLCRRLATPQPRPECAFSAYQCLGLLDVLIAEEELAIEIAQVDRVEVDDVDVAEAREDEVLEELAADTARAHHEHSRLPCGQCVLPARMPPSGRRRTCLMRACSVVPRLWRAYLSRPVAMSMDAAVFFTAACEGWRGRDQDWRTEASALNVGRQRWARTSRRVDLSQQSFPFG